MGYSKCIFNGRTIIDLTSDTVSADKLLEGCTAHGADGEPITGTMKKMTVSDDGNGNVTISGLAVIVS